MALELNIKKIEEIKKVRDAVRSLIDDQTLQLGDHYIEIDGIKKKVLTLSGAELLGQLFDINVKLEVVSDISDPDKNLVDITVKAIAYDKEDNFLGESLGNCNSKEEKFGYEWKEERDVPSNISKVGLIKEEKVTEISAPAFVVKAGNFKTVEEDPKYGKPKEQWDALKNALDNGTIQTKTIQTKAGSTMDLYYITTKVIKYKVPTNSGDKKNTITKMAEKRAKVSVVKYVTNASSYFTQDLDENVEKAEKPPIIINNQEGSIEESPVQENTKPLSTAKPLIYPILSDKLVVTKLKKTYPSLKDMDDVKTFVEGFLKNILKLEDKSISLDKGTYITNSDDPKMLGFKPLTDEDFPALKEIFGNNKLGNGDTALKYKKYLREQGFFDIK